jgi:hypothetical protein
MKRSELKQLIKECLLEQSQDLMAAVEGSSVENISFGVDNKEINIKLVNGVVIKFTSQTPITATNLGPQN